MLHYAMRERPLTRVFKTAWFSKAARKARIGDPALIAAIREVMQGKADDIGGGVFKKRLNKNMHRTRSYWQTVGGIGSLPICLPRRTGPTSMMMSLLNSGNWRRPMAA